MIPRPWPREITIDGDDEVYALRPRTGIWVVEQLAERTFDQIIMASFTDAAAERVTYRLVDPGDHLEGFHIGRAAAYLVRSISALELWPAMNLAGHAYGGPNHLYFTAWAVSVGFNAYTEPADRILAAIYSWLRSSVSDEKQAATLDNQIWAPGDPQIIPPPAGGLKNQWTEEDEAADIAGAVKALPLGEMVT